MFFSGLVYAGDGATGRSDGGWMGASLFGWGGRSDSGAFVTPQTALALTAETDEGDV